jgi:hypothetical protein
MFAGLGDAIPIAKAASGERTVRNDYSSFYGLSSGEKGLQFARICLSALSRSRDKEPRSMDRILYWEATEQLSSSMMFNL